MPIRVTFDQKQFLGAQLNVFGGKIERTEIVPISAAIQYRKDLPAIASYLQEMDALRKALEQHQNRDAPVTLDDRFGPIIKTILLGVRRDISEDVDRRREKTVHPDAITVLNAELEPFDALLAAPWCASETPYPVPRKTEYLTLVEIERIYQEQQIRLAPREYDEKFHLLQAPRLVTEDLTYYRTVAGARGLPAAFAYVDIDDFKRLNSKYTNESIDKYLLPIFMRAIEAATYARGHAYRYGGDEYGIVLGNGKGAAALLDDLRNEVSKLKYHGIEETTTVSVGLVAIAPDCELSNQQAIQRANKAMQHAKDNGKNTIATYEGGYHDKHLIILPKRQTSVWRQLLFPVGDNYFSRSTTITSGDHSPF